MRPRYSSLLTALLTLVASSAAAQTAGSSSLGEPFYAWMGNGGYDVQDYDVSLRVAENMRDIQGSVIIEAVATQDLRVFNLDFGDPRVTGVNVNGLEARSQHRDPELSITPSSPIRRGETFRVRVQYTGRPGSKALAPGLRITSWYWLTSQLIVMEQPSRLLDWIPSNDHPTDKARFTLRLTAPGSLTAAAGGTRTEQRENADGTRTTVFHLPTPTTTYGVFFALSNHVLETNEPVGNIQIRHYLSPFTSKSMQEAVARSGDMVRFFQTHLGAYPFKEFGVLTHTNTLAFALETQTLVALPADWGGLDAPVEQTFEVVAHELAHQWFGMQVTLRDYRDIWLHEGFAEYLGWLYTARASTKFSLEEEIRNAYPSGVNGRQALTYTKARLLEYLRKYSSAYRLYARDLEPALQLLFNDSLPPAERTRILEAGKSGLSVPDLVTHLEKLNFSRVTLFFNELARFASLIGSSAPAYRDDRFTAPGRIVSGDLIFNNGVYRRGATAVYVLRRKLGDEAFWALLRAFLEKYKFSNASVTDFLNLTEERGGKEARALLERWLFDERAPDLPELNLYAKDHTLGADFK
jgi:aminopeptidase N